MNFLSIATTLMRGNIHYALGRFYFVRRFYSFYKKGIEKLSKNRMEFFSTSKSTLFPQISVENSVNNLKKTAVSFGFGLPEEVTREIYGFATKEKCLRSGDRKEFLFSEVEFGKLIADGSAVVLGFVNEALRCEAVRRITEDPILLTVCAKYLGYIPKKIEARLFWSFVTQESDIMRREKWQTTKYHFDVDGFNFIYVNFYITPVTRYSGAHVMMKYSHHHKPYRMLLHSATQKDEAILKYFGSDNEIIIEGPAGLGFVQDSSCYHKALAPITDNRLMLQLRI